MIRGRRRARVDPDPVEMVTVVPRADGLAYVPADAMGGAWFLEPQPQPTSESRRAFVAQLEELGLAELQADHALLVRWSDLHEILAEDDLSPTSTQLPIPPVVDDLLPAVECRGRMKDPDFSIFVSGWYRGGTKVADRLDLVGPVHRGPAASGPLTLGPTAYATLRSILEFGARPTEERALDGNRRGFVEIRDRAVAAGAPMDHYMQRTVILRPQMLSLGLERVHAGSSVGVVVEPTFEGAPSSWLDTFDRHRAVPDVYSCTGDDTEYIEIVVDDQVRRVLSEVRRLPARRVSGQRARRLLENPVAFFGDDDGSVLNEEAIENALEELREGLWSFRPHVELTESGLVEHVTLVMEPLGSQGDSGAHLHRFTAADGLNAFVTAGRDAVTAGRPVIAWADRDLELARDAEHHLEALADIASAWADGRAIVAVSPVGPGQPGVVPSGEPAADARPAPADHPDGALVIDADLVLDLARYAERIEAIGIETLYGIITVPLNKKGAWALEEDELRLLVQLGNSDDAVQIEMNREQLATFVRDVSVAAERGDPTVGLPNGGELPTSQAEDFVDALPASLRQELALDLAPGTGVREKPEPRERTGLLLKQNIDTEDYVTRRADGLRLPEGAPPLLPSNLRPQIELLSHQRHGVAWLQQLFAESPGLCRGALLADDMGLGKTLQILTFAARARQDDPDLGPVLVVAPVSLLDNWRQEAEKFFEDGTLPVRTLYGPGLKEFKVAKRDVDEKLRATGLQRFLRPGWSDGAAVVLTTYETLRDYEFSFAEVGWSIVACDEAQRIKNPNALVSRAAKKLNARFCIAATGTPVENNLTDLWSLFDFIQPGLLEPLNRFNKLYRKPIEADTDEDKARVNELRALIDPQVLRRLKSDIDADLPVKRFDQPCRTLRMTERQQQLYRMTLAAQEVTAGAANAGTALLTMISLLRRVCTDPRSARELNDPLPPLTDYRRLAPKLDWLITTLEDIERRDEKAIVFMDRKDIQRLVQHYVRERFGFAPEIINGETSTSALSGDSRQQRVDRFQSRPGFSVLILSPVAAGVGLNIQQANHVIHYMRHWNPAKEDQATDRAYRIGQQKDVVVYTPIVVGDEWTSFDERLDDLLSRKRKIADDMLNGSEDVDLGREFADLVRVQGQGLTHPDKSPSVPAEARDVD